MSKVIETLRREHANIMKILNILDSEIAYLAEFKRRRRSDYRLVWSAIDYLTDFPELAHHPKEDMIFERLREADPSAALAAGDIPGSHALLALELRELGIELKAVMEDAKRPRAALIAAARTFVRHLRDHLEFEEGRFFVIADRALDARIWAELERRMTAKLDPLIDGPASERFEALRRNIEERVTSQHVP